MVRCLVWIRLVRNLLGQEYQRCLLGRNDELLKLDSGVTLRSISISLPIPKGTQCTHDVQHGFQPNLLPLLSLSSLMTSSHQVQELLLPIEMGCHVRSANRAFARPKALRRTSSMKFNSLSESSSASVYARALALRRHGTMFGKERRAEDFSGRYCERHR